ncbi:MAG: phosphate permease [Deltaproteobacteria bacterium HGW-Deltaproteobacteria-15]|nr:MAG: phosphate permease [Deltaproteobacteria bacterium HGW-Deltaproteobacteria-15]
MNLLIPSAEGFILTAATLIGLYMAVNIGANDLANAMGTSVGSGALTLKGAVLTSMFFTLGGAILAGGYVSNTIRKGIIDPTLLAGSPEKLLLGMFAALLAAGIWVHLATHYGMPISTTHAIVGAVVGFGVLAVGPGAISWGKMASIVASWVVSPVAGGLASGTIYIMIRRKILSSDFPYKATQVYAPWLLSAVFYVIVLSIAAEGLRNLPLMLGFWQTLLLVLPLSMIAGFGGKILLLRLGGVGCRWIKGTDIEKVNCVFSYMQIATACYVAYAHGSNDVANAVGPLAAIYSIVKTGTVSMSVEVPMWMLAMGGIAIGGGLLVLGGTVMETIGGKITEITPVRGFCAEFGAATTILVCSHLGLPISTTHVLVGSVIGVGFARGMGMLDLRVVRNIVSSWLTTLPFTIVLAMIFYWVLSGLLFP